ncbi:hypothetical protein MCY_01525 [Bartonella rattimassiliensis 15908]|uniref:Uncharacterized protein n=1 Tax=Bartonella rattimassiliensis 15908 TaxID=1094556 RepID=J0QJB1_9HYPH|nr:hypothetical protein MCY_01525 [Bartonella rattimassiliensis 15908]
MGKRSNYAYLNQSPYNFYSFYKTQKLLFLREKYVSTSGNIKNISKRCFKFFANTANTNLDRIAWNTLTRRHAYLVNYNCLNYGIFILNCDLFNLDSKFLHIALQ